MSSTNRKHQNEASDEEPDVRDKINAACENNRDRMQKICDAAAMLGCVQLLDGHWLYSSSFLIENRTDAIDRAEIYRLALGEESCHVHNYRDAPFWVFHRYALDTYPFHWPTPLSRISEDVRFVFFEDGVARWNKLKDQLEYIEDQKSSSSRSR